MCDIGFNKACFLAPEPPPCLSVYKPNHSIKNEDGAETRAQDASLPETGAVAEPRRSLMARVWSRAASHRRPLRSFDHGPFLQMSRLHLNPLHHLCPVKSWASGESNLPV